MLDTENRDRIVVVGAGGHGSEVHAYICKLVELGWGGELVGFLDDVRSPGVHANMEVLGPVETLLSKPNEYFRGLRFITAVGDNAGRKQLVARLEKLYGERLQPWTLIDPAAWIGKDVQIGDGTLVAPGAVITSRVRIGKHCIVNVKVSVSHDSTIGDYVSINPGATICGHCRIGNGAFIGTGATVINGVEIGDGSVIGGGAAVISNIPPNVTAVGVPARVIRQN